MWAVTGLLALMTAQATSAPQAVPASVAADPAGLWVVYGGDYESQSAMDAASLRREGSVVRFRKAYVGLHGPTLGRQGGFDYAVVESAYDCVRKTQWSERASFYDRSHKLLWSEASPADPRPTVNSSEPSYFMPIACDGEKPQNPNPSLHAYFAKFRWWADPNARAPGLGGSSTQADVHFYREGGSANPAPIVKVNGKRVAIFGPASAAFVQLPPGQQEVEVSWTRMPAQISSKQVLDLEAGRAYYFSLSSSPCLGGATGGQCRRMPDFTRVPPGSAARIVARCCTPVTQSRRR